MLTLGGSLPEAMEVTSPWNHTGDQHRGRWSRMNQIQNRVEQRARSTSRQERSRAVAELYEKYTMDQKTGGEGMPPKAVVKQIAEELEISTVSVNINLPYGKTVYDLEEKSSNAKRIEKHRAKKR